MKITIEGSLEELAGLAQLAERRTCNAEVGGSNPSPGSICSQIYKESATYEICPHCAAKPGYLHFAGCPKTVQPFGK